MSDRPSRMVRRTHGPKRRMCAYCGKALATTMDHAVPKCLFVPPLPTDMVTVPACDPCNKRKGEDEEYLRDVLVSDIWCSDHPVAKVLLEGKVSRAIQRNCSDFAKAVQQHSVQRPLYTPGGIYLGDIPAVRIDSERFRSAISMIVRGLYHKLMKQAIPDGYAFDIRRIPRLNAAELWGMMLEKKANGPFNLGDVFDCLFLYAIEDPGATSWL